MIYRITILVVVIAGLISACGAQAPSGDVQVIPTQEIIQGQVTIDAPLDGSIIYSDTITIMGSAEDRAADDGFLLQLLLTDDSVLAEETITPAETDRWSVTLEHGYNGEPSQLLIVAFPIGDTGGQDYALASVVVADEQYRPDGTFGTILSPSPEAVVGGDQIEVIGTASGLFENTLIIALEERDGTLISREIITVNNPNFIDEMLWSADVQTEGYTGNARVRIYYTSARDGEEITLDQRDVVVSVAAG